jgi:hypothetical protein
MVSVFASSVVDREFFSDKNIQWRNDDMDGLYYTVIISLSNLRINWMLGLITSNSDSGVNMNSKSFFPVPLQCITVLIETFYIPVSSLF